MSFPTSKANAAAIAMPSWGRWVRRSSFVLAAMMCVYMAAAIWGVRGNLANASQQVPWRALPVVIGLVVLGWAVRLMRWQYYVRRLGWPIPAHDSAIAFFASFAFSATPGKAGELVKSVLLRSRYNVPLADGAGVLMVERIGDLLAVLVLALGGLALLPQGLVYCAIAALLVGGLAIFVSIPPIYRPILSRFGTIPKFSRLVDRVLGLLEMGRTLLRPVPFLIGLGLALVAWGCEGLAFHILIQNFGVRGGAMTACSIYGIATVVGALSFLPGGLGSFEAVMILLLSKIGLPATAAMLPVVLFRFCSLWLGCLVGLLFLMGWLFCAPRKNDD